MSTPGSEFTGSDKDWPAECSFVAGSRIKWQYSDLQGSELPLARCDEMGVQGNRSWAILVTLFANMYRIPARSGLAAHYKEINDVAH